MAEELLSLKWNNHQSHFVDILTFLREQEIFIDATLACGGKLYPAHKFVLSTCSDYFKQMFTKNPSKHPIVFMKDVTCRDLEALLDFMYNGEVNVPQSSLGSLIKTAEGLQIKGLAVPDDPPAPKRDFGIVRRDLKATRDNSYSPPPKRLRATREKSPHLSSSASVSFPSATMPPRSRSPSHLMTSVATSILPLEASVDEDSRTSAQSALSEHSPNMNSKPNLNNQSHFNNEDSTSQSDHLNHPSNKEPSPGPSGLHKPPQSKEEELDIKQEDVVDLGDHDDGDWGGGGEGDGSMDDGGGGDSLTSENAPNFSDVLVPPSDGSLNTTGDPAMRERGGVNGGGGGTAAAVMMIAANHNNQLLCGDSSSATTPPPPPCSSSSSAAAAAAAAGHGGFDSLHHQFSLPHPPRCGSSPLSLLGGASSSSNPIGGGFGSNNNNNNNFSGPPPPPHPLPSMSSLGMDVSPSMYRFLLESSSNTGGGGGASASVGGGGGPAGAGSLLLSSASSLSLSHLPLSFDEDQRPFPCQFCDARFKKKQHLQNHERIHTGEKYVCILCGQGFSRLHILKHHVGRKHNIPDSPPASASAGGAGGGAGASSSSSMIQHN